MPAVVQFRAGKALTVRSAADVFLGSLGTFSQAELTVDRVITRFITRSRRCPPLPSRPWQVSKLWVPSWCYGPAVSHRRTRRSPPPDSFPGRGPSCRCSMTSNSRRCTPCLRATRSDRPQRSARPAGRKALIARASSGRGRVARDGSARGRKRSGRATEGRQECVPVRRGEPRPRRQRCGPSCPGHGRTGGSCGGPCARHSPVRRGVRRRRRNW